MSIRAKIAALRAKTRAAGCTEAEAMAAAEVAARLMRDHGLSEDDLVMTDAAVDEPSSRINWRWELGARIAALTNCASIWSDGKLLFIGRAPGPDIAAYLTDLCVRAVDREVARFRQDDFYRRRRTPKTRTAATKDFTEAMAARLKVRLTQLLRPTHDPALFAAARSALAQRFPSIRDCTRSSRKPRFDEAGSAGHAAGNRTRLDPGVTTAPPRQIALFGE